MQNKFDSLKIDDEDKENVPPQAPTFDGFSSRRKPKMSGFEQIFDSPMPRPGPPMPRSSSATKRDSFGAIVTGQNLAGPPLKLRVNINNLNRVSKKRCLFYLSRVAGPDWAVLYKISPKIRFKLVIQMKLSFI